MAWRLARSLERLRSQINDAYPRRSKASDGTIGDAAHSARASDHNPDAGGVVRALDITHDPANGIAGKALANALLASRDTRIKYIISDGEIASGAAGPKPWTWRKYSGANQHRKHVHISVVAGAAGDDDRRWSITLKEINEVAPSDSVLKIGSKGPFVTELQQSLNRLGFPIAVDGVYGKATEAAVTAFQKQSGLMVDGWAGPRTLKAIGEALAAQAAAPRIKAAELAVPDSAGEEVSARTSWWQKATALLSGSGALGGWLLGLDWQAALVVAGTGIVILLLILLLRRQIIAAFHDINKAAEGR
jgi:hypothetical protein